MWQNASPRPPCGPARCVNDKAILKIIRLLPANLLDLQEYFFTPLSYNE